MSKKEFYIKYINYIQDQMERKDLTEEKKKKLKIALDKFMKKINTASEENNETNYTEEGEPENKSNL